MRQYGIRGLALGGRGGHCARWTAAALGSGLVTLILSHGAYADNFSKAYYDSRVDQLVVSMIIVARIQSIRLPCNGGSART